MKKNLSVAFLCLSLCFPLLGQKEYYSFPHKKEIYKKGWIDFNKNGKKDVYEDPTKTIDERIDDLLSQMNLDEKSCQLSTYYGYKKALKDSVPTDEWLVNVLKDGIANIDEHLNKEIADPNTLAKALAETQRFCRVYSFGNTCRF